MSRACSRLSAEHRRKVGEGVRRAWVRRYKEGFSPKGPKGQIAEIARVLMCEPARAVEMVKWLDDNHRLMCERLHDRCQKYHLGLGGEHVDVLVCEELDRLKAGSQ